MAWKAVGCEPICKDTKMKAIHNGTRQCKPNNDAVSLYAKILK